MFPGYPLFWVKHQEAENRLEKKVIAGFVSCGHMDINTLFYIKQKMTNKKVNALDWLPLKKTISGLQHGDEFLPSEFIPYID